MPAFIPPTPATGTPAASPAAQHTTAKPSHAGRTTWTATPLRTRSSGRPKPHKPAKHRKRPKHKAPAKAVTVRAGKAAPHV